MSITQVTEKPMFAAGDKVHVWLIGQFVEARIIDHFHWTHQSGNTYVAYRFDIGTGVMCGGHNGIMEVTDPDWFNLERIPDVSKQEA